MLGGAGFLPSTVWNTSYYTSLPHPWHVQVWSHTKTVATKAETAIAVLTCWAVVAMARLALLMVSKTCHVPKVEITFVEKRSTHVLHPMISVFYIRRLFWCLWDLVFKICGWNCFPHSELPGHTSSSQPFDDHRIIVPSKNACHAI